MFRIKLNVSVILGECVPTDESCTSMKCNAGTTYISNVDNCPELRCASSDCEKCVGAKECTWTRHVVREGKSYQTLIYFSVMKSKLMYD